MGIFVIGLFVNREKLNRDTIFFKANSETARMVFPIILLPVGEWPA